MILKRDRVLKEIGLATSMNTKSIEGLITAISALQASNKSTETKH